MTQAKPSPLQRKALALTVVFFASGLILPQLSFSYFTPLLPETNPGSLRSLFIPNDFWLDGFNRPQPSLAAVDEIFSPLERIEAPERDNEIFSTQLNTLNNGSHFLLMHEKGRIRSSLSFNFSVSGGAQSLAPPYRIERGEYGQRPWEIFEPAVSFLDKEIPVSWKGLKPASEVSSFQNIYHYFSADSRIQLTDRTDLYTYYQGSDFREETESARFSLSRSAQTGGELTHYWSSWLKSSMGFKVTRDGWEEPGHSSLTTVYGPDVSLRFSLPTLFGQGKGSSIKFFGSLERVNWSENKTLTSYSLNRQAGAEFEWKLSKDLTLTPGFRVTTQNDLWEGESYLTQGHRSYLKLEKEQKWGRIKLSLSLDTPIEYRLEHSNQKQKFLRGVNIGWGVVLKNRVELSHRYSFFTPYAAQKRTEEHPQAMDMSLKYQLGKKKDECAFRLHGGYLSSSLSSEKSSPEAVFDGAFVLEF